MNRLTPFLAATFTAIAVAAVYLGNELRLQKNQNEQFELRVAELETAREAASAMAAPVLALSEIEGTQDAMPAPGEASVPGSAPQSAPPAKQSLEETLLRVMESAEGQDFARIMTRSMLEQRYPDMAKALNLSAEQVDEVLDFLARREAGMDALELRLQRTRDRAAREDLRRSMGEKRQADEAELSNLLGNSYPEWQEYDLASRDRQREGYTRQGEDRMRAAIVAGGSPLSDAQFQSLTAALREEETRFNLEASNQSVQEQMQRLPELARRQAEASAPILDADQQARLRKHLEDMYGSVGAMMDVGAMMGLMDEDYDE